MRKIAFTLMAILAMTGVTYAVTFNVVDNGLVGTKLQGYTIQATGTGINELGKFTISGTVNQTGGAWLGNGSAGGATDSAVLFGDLRLPDVAGGTWDPAQGTQPTAITSEAGGTLNNYSATGPTWDAYLQTGTPSTSDMTVSLLKVVLPFGTPTTNIDLTVWTSTGANFATQTAVQWTGSITAPPDVVAYWPGDATMDGNVNLSDLSVLGTNWGSTTATWAQGDFTADGNVNLSDLSILGTNWGHTGGFGEAAGGEAAAAVPEPGTIAMLILGALCLVGYRLRK
jgi:hypothetical protein